MIFCFSYRSRHVVGDVAPASTPDRVGYTWHPEGVMTSQRSDVPSVSEICDHVKHLGYAASRRIRVYGEEFEVVSDPFPEGDGIAVRVTTKKDSGIRVLRVPATVLQTAKGRAGLR